MKKKILAALMAAVMLFTILPLGTLDTAWAEERASASADSESISNEALLDGYLYSLAGMDIRSYETGFNSASMAASYSAKANLSAVEQAVYSTLKAEIEKIASGQRKDTSIKTTGVLGSQSAAIKVWHALLADLPYELYWHDKTKGVGFTYSGSFKDVTFSFAVAEDFRGADMNTTNIPNVPAAVQTARSVVAANASKSDYNKLQAYRQYICDQVSYNYAAARGEYTGGYGSPWQLLWVFDGDASTNVVCEGYAKAFKYLCDLTAENNGWTGDVETICVTGKMDTEDHMWNIVRIGGGNYLVDVTNCDTGMKGYPEKLFLRGAVGDGISYTVENIVYLYGEETRTGFAAADLKLSGTDYTPAAETLTAPTMTLKADASSGQPVISWTKVSGAAQYEVYRSATGKANSFSIIRRTAALSYTDTGAAAGNTYYYVVRAMKGSGSSATYSRFSKAQHITYTLASLAAPAMTLTSADSGQPVISWTKVSGAAQYEIYRSVDGKKFSIIRRTAALSYTDTTAVAGTTYYYQVRAINGDVKSAFCAAQTIKYAITSLTAPTMTLKADASSGQPVISWTKVSGAAQYEIYRSVDGKKFSIIRRTAALSYTDTTAVAGTTYYYQVRAINGDVKSAFCAAQTIKYAITSLTAPTMTLKADASSGQPVISWTKVSGAAQYEIYRSVDGKKFSIIRRTAALSYTDTTAVAGTTYYYQVRAINGDVKSAFCAAQSIKYAIASLTAPTMTLTSAADGQPVVSWTKVDGAAQYEVYRSTNGKNFSIVRRTAALSYTDTTAAAGTTYYYQVRAINGDVKSAFCAAQSIKYAIASLAAPAMTLTITDNGQPVVSWTKVDGAAQYEVYRSADGSKFSIVRRTAALSYTDTTAAAGATYYYQVRAINGDVKSDFCPAQSISLTVSEYGGECGSRVTWRLTDDGVLTISGKDGIYEYGWYEEDDVYHPAPWAEEGMPAVKKLVVSNGITYIGSWAFSGLEQLASVSLPDTLEYIGGCAFRDCTSLTSIVIPEGTETLSDAFVGCTSLCSVTLPSTLQDLAGCVFMGCTSLRDIVLPEGLTVITWRMFDGCTSLRSVTIPGSVISVSSEAFSGCTALTSVIFGGSRADWEGITFNTGNDALRRVTPTCTGSTGLAAPAVTGSTDRSGMPLIQWNKVSGAAGYQLWCSPVWDEYGAAYYDLYADWDEEWFWDGNCCSYLNNGSLEDGVTYSYKVRAVDANGNVGAFSKEVRITFEPVLATPVISVTTNAQYQPVLTWDKVSGAGYYEVWRWCEEDEADQRIRRTAGLTWTDTTAELGKSYWYYLRAYSPDWNFTTDTGSYYSAWGYSMRWSVLDTPEITEVYTPEAGKAVLGWTKVSGADQYEIYRSTDDENYSLVNRTSALSWTDTTVQSGRVYYKIRAVINVGDKQGYSDFAWTNFFVR